MLATARSRAATAARFIELFHRMGYPPSVPAAGATSGEADASQGAPTTNFLIWGMSSKPTCIEPAGHRWWPADDVASPDSKRGRQDVVWRFEGHAGRLRDRGRERPQERGPSVIDLPAQQHGVVLVHGVVAVLHEHPAPVAELHRQRDTPGWAETIDVLAALFPRRHVRGTSIASQDLALFEVDVDGVIPATATVDQSPDLARTIARRCRDPAEVGGKHTSAIRPDAPRAVERADGVGG